MLGSMRFVGVSALSATLAVAAQRPALVVPLKFVPQEAALDASVALPSAMLDRTVEIRLDDARVLTDPALIGEGVDGPFQVRAKGDAVQFVKEVVTSLAGSRGLKATTPGARQLRIRLTRLWIVESHRTVGSVYAAEVQFAYVLADSSGRSIFGSTASAAANRYGRARNVENCMEVLSDALKEAVLSVFADPKLQAAWAAEASTAVPTGAAIEPTRKSVELKVGMTEAEAIAAIGQPLRRLTLTDRTLLQYADLVITVVSGKVTDFQVR